MSRNVTLTGRYLNGKQVSVGWFDGRNADMVETNFTLEDYGNLVLQFEKEKGSRIIKEGSVIIKIIQSYSEVQLQFTSVEMNTKIWLLPKESLFKQIDYNLRFKPHN